MKVGDHRNVVIGLFVFIATYTSDVMATTRSIFKAVDFISVKVQKFREIVGSSPAIKRMLDLTIAVASSEATVLIIGETGTGKELVAKAIHDMSNRRNKDFLILNCPAIPEQLFESEAYGYCKHAFTGALLEKPGKFELAKGGTVQIDEIGELPLRLQAKLLRFLESKTLERLGGRKHSPDDRCGQGYADHTRVAVDVRIIATTNKDLRTEAACGNFRNDLYYRLNVVTIKLPALRDRKDDLPMLCKHFLEKFTQRENKMIAGITDEALHALTAYDFPGNVRELEKAMERAVVLATAGEYIELTHFPEDILEFNQTRNKMRLVQSSNREDKIIELLRTGSLAEITNKTYRHLFSVSNKTAYEELRNLCNRGILKTRGRARNIHYILSESV